MHLRERLPFLWEVHKRPIVGDRWMKLNSLSPKPVGPQHTYAPIVSMSETLGLEIPSWSHDHVLNALQGLADPVGSLVRAFPGRRDAADDEWLEKWFTKMVRSFIKGRGPDLEKIVASAVGDGDISALTKPPVQESVRLSSIRPSYFRGFRAPVSAISLDANLIVLEGRNSSGKTSVLRGHRMGVNWSSLPTRLRPAWSPY